MCVFSFSTPLLFIAGSYGTNREAPCALVEAVGPTGQVGRPARATNRPQLLLAGYPGPLCLVHVGVGLS